MHENYAGFWLRLFAFLVDGIILITITFPVLLAAYGMDYYTDEEAPLVRGPLDFVVSWIFPAIAVIWFWVKKQATPGKMAVNLKIVDASTGGKPTTGQFIGRYLGYYISAIPLGLGYFWIAFDKRKQGWHDKLSNTVVIKKQ